MRTERILDLEDILPGFKEREERFRKYKEYLEKNSFNPDGTFRTNEDYQSILELDKKLTKLNIPHELRKYMDGWIIDYPCAAESKGDVIQHIMVMGSNIGFMEAYGFGLKEPIACLDVQDAMKYFVKQYTKDRISDAFTSIKESFSKIIPYLKELKEEQEEKTVEKVCQERGVDYSDIMPESFVKEICTNMHEDFPPKEYSAPNWKTSMMKHFTKVE